MLILLPIEPEEAAFALTLFMSAAIGHVAPGLQPARPDDYEEVRAGEAFFLALCASTPQRRLPAGVVRGPRDERLLQTKLYHAFRAVWSHYRGDPQRNSVCARALGFYHLTEQTGGAIVERWTRPAGAVEAVTLHPAVITAIASVPLTGAGVLREQAFREHMDVVALAYEADPAH